MCFGEDVLGIGRAGSEKVNCKSMNAKNDPHRRLQRWVSQSLAVDALRTIAQPFHENGIPVCPVKGVVLGRWLYGDVAERPLCDLDVLIRRRDRAAVRREIERRGWRLVRDSEELGELEFIVGGFTVEAHAEVVRRDLTVLSVEDFLARSTKESETFGFEIHHIDDVDHTLLLCIEVVKDWFVEANAHQPEDLERMMARIAGRIPELIDRATEAGFVTGLYNAARWLAEEHGSESFRALLERLGSPRRKLQPYLVRRMWKAGSPNRHLGLAVSCWTNDRLPVRTRCLATIARRGAWRALGLDPG
jgi:hypothetical protein